MATYLFLWNPKKWAWKDLQKQVEELSAGKKVNEPWSTGNRTKGLDDGDRFLLMKLGEEPKGIIACGTINNFRYRRHWDSQKANLGKKLPNVDLNFQILSAQPLIEQDELEKRFASEVSSWTPNASGIVIPDNVADNIFKILKARQPSEITKITQSVLFARIGYMEYYQGAMNGDFPIGGGSYNKDNTGFEACNFLDVGGKVYGYYQPSMNSGKINLERINPKKAGLEKLENVLVIFFSTLPKALAQQNPTNEVNSSSAVIVGWYKNATVFRDAKQIDREIHGIEQNIYFIEAKTTDSYLLPVDKRVYKIGHGIKGEKEGNPGQSNSFYIYDKNKNIKDLNNLQNNWIGKAIEYVKTYSGECIKSDQERAVQNAITSQFRSNRKGGAGFQCNALVRVAVEQHAMKKAEEALTIKGYEVRLTHKNGQSICGNSSFDMIAYKDGNEYFVEVKGTQSNGSSVIFTYNEVELYKDKTKKVILCVVHSIQLKDDIVNIKTGEVIIHDPWKLDTSKLKEISYFYTF